MKEERNNHRVSVSFTLSTISLDSFMRGAEPVLLNEYTRDRPGERTPTTTQENDGMKKLLLHHYNRVWLSCCCCCFCLLDYQEQCNENQLYHDLI